MDEIIKFLNDTKVYFLATVNEDKASVRPIGFVMKYDNQLTFCTANNKPMYKQMKKNPNVEISAFNGESTLRISGKAVFNTSDESLKEAFTVMPMLESMYSDKSIFETFYIDSPVIFKSKLTGEIEEIKIK